MNTVRVLWRLAVLVLLGRRVLLGAVLAQGALTGYSSRIWTVGDGLQDQQIQAIAQTTDQYLWLGTSHGLIRFDGRNFVELGAQQVPQLTNFGVSALYAARDGSLWIGMNGGGVVRLAQGRFTQYGAAEGLQNLFVQSLLVDDRGVLWAGTDHGLYHLVENRFVRQGRMGQIADPSVNTIINDHQGGIWFAGHHLAHLYGQLCNDIKFPPSAGPLRIKAIALDGNGVLWIGTLRGLYRMEAGQKVTQVANLPYSIRALAVDAHRRLWIGTIGHGVYVRNADGKVVLAEQSVRHATIAAIFEHPYGDIWLGLQDGLVRLGHTGITLHPMGDPTDVRSVAPDGKRGLWFCSGRAFQLNAVRQMLLGDLLHLEVPIRVVLRDHMGATWVGTAGRGVYRITAEGTVASDSIALGNSYVNGLLESSDGTIWIATDSGVAAWRNRRVITYQSAKGAPHEPVTAMAEAPQGGLWVGTSRGLLLLQNGQFRTDSVSAALGAQRIRSLMVDSIGGLWVGTESGAYRWHNEALVHAFLNNDGSGMPIVALLESGEKIWFASPTTVVRIRFDELNRELREVSERTGGVWRAQGAVAKETFNLWRETGAGIYGGNFSLATADGHGGAWFATNKGPLHIDAAVLIESLPPPPVMIQRVAVDGNTWSNLDAVQLEPSARILEIEPEPIHLVSRSGVRLRWRLRGFEDEWHSLPASHVVTLAKLPPGKYVFEVESSWTGNSAVSHVELKIVQSAIFYQRAWFLALCIVLLGLCVWGYFRYRLQQTVFRHQMVYEERNRIAREMHDTLLQGSIGISSLLEGMASISAAAQKRGEPFSERLWVRNFEAARAQIKLSIAEMRSAIWGLRKAEEEQSFADSVKAQLQHLTEMYRIASSFECSKDLVSLDTWVEHELFMALREILRNAILHAHPRAISVEILCRDALLEIVVDDDGCGFDPEHVGQEGAIHFGLKGLQERMALIGGVCIIESIVGQGTSVRLRLPVNVCPGGK